MVTMMSDAAIADACAKMYDCPKAKHESFSESMISLTPKMIPCD